MNVIFAEVMHLKQASQDKKITVGELLDAVRIALDKLGLSETVVIDLEKVNL